MGGSRGWGHGGDEREEDWALEWTWRGGRMDGGIAGESNYLGTHETDTLPFISLKKKRPIEDFLACLTG